jgi:hypothetical protein
MKVKYKDYSKAPKFVYHGSPNGEIKEFTPRVSLGTGEKYGPQVYASDNKITAKMFMADVGRSWSTGKTANNTLYAIIPLSRKEFVKKDKGGFLYTLPGKTFSSDPNRGMGNEEWASPVAVKPIEVNKFDSVLDAMIDDGVQVYFVSDELYKEMISSGKPKYEFLKEITSENQYRNLNIKSL